MLLFVIHSLPFIKLLLLLCCGVLIRFPLQGKNLLNLSAHNKIAICESFLAYTRGNQMLLFVIHSLPFIKLLLLLCCGVLIRFPLQGKNLLNLSAHNKIAICESFLAYTRGNQMLLFVIHSLPFIKLLLLLCCGVLIRFSLQAINLLNFVILMEFSPATQASRYQRHILRFSSANSNIDMTQLAQIAFKPNNKSRYFNETNHDMPGERDRGYISFDDYENSRLVIVDTLIYDVPITAMHDSY